MRATLLNLGQVVVRIDPFLEHENTAERVKSAAILADSVLVRIRRTLKWLVAWVVVTVTLIATGPTIWHDAIHNVQTYLHTSRTLAMAIVVVPVALIVLIVAFVRIRNWQRVRRMHRAVRQDALRNLHL